MASRSIWKGTIQFGLVGFPVEMRPAVRADHVPFRLLNADDLTPVHMERMDESGHPVAWEEIVKGFELEKGRYVVMTDEDFRAAALRSSRAFEICDFVKEGEIDPRYFDTPYYLTPGQGGDKAYAILREALRRTGMVGVGKVMIRQKQHLAALKTVGEALVLETMRFASELVDTRDLKFPRAQLATGRELKIAEELVGAMASGFDPEKYHDEYRENLMRIIRAKGRGKPVAAPAEPEPEDGGVIDLMSRLKASLDAAEGRRGGGGSTAKKSGAARKSAARKSGSAKDAAPRKSAGKSPKSSTSTKPKKAARTSPARRSA
ncbi:MAG: repair protein [Gemmatimonadetes bacterium]|nr:repair protein [Gemmatimonadota bacterium]